MDNSLTSARIDGQEGVALTGPLLDFLNKYPDFEVGESIVFGDSTHSTGLAMYPVTGVLVISETEDITGHHVKNCQYPFYLVYKVGQGSAARAISIKEFLDDIGQWCERQDYDSLDTSEVKVTSIARQTVAAMDSIEVDGTQNWIISITMFYTREWQEKGWF